MPTRPRPVVFAAFANDEGGAPGYLRHLDVEQRAVRDALAETHDWCEHIERPDASLDDFLDVLQTCRDRIAIIHYAGHSTSHALLLQSATRRAEPAIARGLAAFIAQQRGLQLMFLNGCSTVNHVADLLTAGVRTVIATSQAIDDWAATQFAGRFYRGLASGASIRVSFHEAEAAVVAAGGAAPREIVADGAAADDGRPLWQLHLADQDAGDWSLRVAANNPLFGLPPLPPRPLHSPFPGLHWYGAPLAEIFFGRSREIRELYDHVTASDGPPILLLFGQSGVGKSSLLSAGLFPRLEQVCHVQVHRCTREVPLAEALARLLNDGTPAVSLSVAWIAAEARLERPLVIVLDQAEELVLASADTTSPFLVLHELFCSTAQRPRGRLIVSFRKEWYAEIEAALASLASEKYFVRRFDQESIEEVVEGLTRTPRLARHYGLRVVPPLATTIAGELLGDPDSPIAPLLQVTLMRMWKEAIRLNAEEPVFDATLYADQKYERLDAFIEEQLVEVAADERFGAAAASGLVLELLAHHTTEHGSTERTLADLRQRYASTGQDIGALLDKLVVVSLLSDGQAEAAEVAATRSTRLAHDTLAPLIRERLARSPLPAQVALRILDSRAHEWNDDQIPGHPLDPIDLGTVERGLSGLATPSPAAARLLDTSRKHRARVEASKRTARIIRTVVTIVVIALTVAAVVFAFRERRATRRADQRAEEAIENALIAEFMSGVENSARNALHELVVVRGRDASWILDRAEKNQSETRVTTLGDIQRKYYLQSAFELALTKVCDLGPLDVEPMHRTLEMIEEHEETTRKTREVIARTYQHYASNTTMLGTLLAAVDVAASTAWDPEAASFRALRAEMLAWWRTQHPPPALDPAQWVLVSIHGLAELRQLSGRSMDADNRYGITSTVDELSFWISRQPVDEPAYRQFRRHGNAGTGPVTTVSWYDAHLYASWLGGALPTSAQWFSAFAEDRILLGRELGYQGPEGTWWDLLDAEWCFASTLGFARRFVDPVKHPFHCAPKGSPHSDWTPGSSGHITFRVVLPKNALRGQPIAWTAAALVEALQSGDRFRVWEAARAVPDVGPDLQRAAVPALEELLAQPADDHTQFPRETVERALRAARRK